MKKLILIIAIIFTNLVAQGQCWADFSYTQNGPTAIFTDLSVVAPSNPWGTNYSLSWNWDFGDGITSTLQNPIHTYANGSYTPCLTLTFFDSTTMNICISIYCDSIVIVNAPPASWDCTPATGCYNPGTGLGQYTSLTTCQAACGPPTPSWDCSANTPVGCYDPGTGLGQYASLTACQAVCGAPTPSWDCGPAGCYDPGTGLGQYSTLQACQSACVGPINTLLCDSLTITSTGGSNQVFLFIFIPIGSLPPVVDYWVTTSNNGIILGEDSTSVAHNVHNINPITTLPYDTINTCLTYTINSVSTFTCCVTWIWNGTTWVKMGSATSIGEFASENKKLIKIVDMLGRETKAVKNESLFYIYDDGTVEKQIIIE